MSHLNRVVSVLSLSLAACGNQAAPEPETPMPPPAEATAPTTPSVAAASDQNTVPSDTGATSGTATPGTAATDTAPKAEPLTDEQILMIVDLANTAEVDQAKVAQGKAKNARVKKFAQTMINHHGDAKQKGAKLTKKLGVTPAESTLSSQLSSDSSTMLSSLKNTAAPDFDRTYIDQQIEAHAKVLATIDNQLLTNAKNADLKALLTEIRPKVEAHLAEAKDIQQALANSAATPAATGAKGAGATPSGTGTGTGATGKSGSGMGTGTGAGTTGSNKSGSSTTPDGTAPGGKAPGGTSP